jgi:hypothetical protein
MGYFWTANMVTLLIVFPVSFKKEIVFDADPMSVFMYSVFSHSCVDINFNIFAERYYFLVFLRFLSRVFVDFFKFFYL